MFRAHLKRQRADCKKGQLPCWVQWEQFLRSLLLVLPLYFGLMPTAVAEPINIVANTEASPDTWDRTTLRSIFSLRLRQWPDGKPIRVLVLAEDHPVHQQFCRENLGVFPYILGQAWDRYIYTGTGLKPRLVSDEAQMKSALLNTPGSIGYLRQSEVGSLPGEFVQVRKRVEP